MYLIEYKKRPVAAAERLSGPQIFRIRNAHSGFRLNRLDNERSETPRFQLTFQRVDRTEGNDRCFRQQRAESFSPEFVAHQRQGAAGEAMKRMLGSKYSRPMGMGASEFNGSLHAFTSGRSEKGFVQPAACSFTETLCQFSRKVRHMALNHRGPA
jgi:hypothetical protein